MKTYTLTSVLIGVLCMATFAQQDNLSPDAKALFNGVPSKLSAIEKNTIAQLSQFTLNAQDSRLYRTTHKEEANVPFEVRLYVLDFTNDGNEEIAMVYGPKSGEGKRGIASMLFVKDADGHYRLNIDVPGEFYFLNVSDLAFPDVLIKNETVGLPTYRWDGNMYNKHKYLEPKKLKRFVVSSIIQTSNRYTAVTATE